MKRAITFLFLKKDLWITRVSLWIVYEVGNSVQCLKHIRSGLSEFLQCFDSALSIVLGNAKYWQSERRKRIVGRALSTNRIKRPHRQEECETDSEL